MKAPNKKTWLSSLITVAVLVAGYYIYQYSYVVSNYYEYVTFYYDVHGLQPSTPIKINGVRVGYVTDVEINNNNSPVQVTMAILKKVKITDSTIALLSAPSLNGSMSITIQEKEGNRILGQKDTMIAMYDTSILDMSDQVATIAASAKYTIAEADSNLSEIRQQIRNGLVANMIKRIALFEKDMKRYQSNTNRWNEQADDVVISIRNTELNAREMAADAANTSKSLRELEKNTKEASKTTIVADLKNISKNVRELRNAVAKATDKDSSLGKLLNEKETYTEANKSAEDLDKDLKDVQENPPVISIIGGD